MHFSKTYSQLLLSLPPDLRDNTVQYRQLKKVINQIVDELNSLGLKPEVLHEYIESGTGKPDSRTESTEYLDASQGGPSSSTLTHPISGLTSSESLTVPEASAKSRSSSIRSKSRSPPPKVVYELNEDAKSGKIEPQLRVWLNVPNSPPALLMEPTTSKSKGKRRMADNQDESTDESASETSHLGEEEVEEVVSPGVEDQDNLIGGRAAIHGHTTHNMTPSLLWALQRGLGVSKDNLDEELSPPPEEEADDDKYSGDRAPDSSHPSHALRPPSPSPTISLESSTTTQELIIPLHYDTQFFNMLSGALEGVSTHMEALHSEFEDSIKNLAKTIGDTSHPASVIGNFHPHSRLKDNAGAVRVKTVHMKNDLYAWREIFQLYIETEVFESVNEIHHGENNIEESEHRLQQFAERVTKRGLGDGREFRLKQSVEALQTFLDLNIFILNIKKYSQANSEATRKILKKHAKRTALPLPRIPSPSSSDPSQSTETLQRLHITDPRHPHHPQQPLLTLIANSSASSLPRMLVQAIGEILLPVIPSLDDYSCLICTSLAFKPIRLSCGHLFCVRCLVKMQKRGKGDCPMCRSQSVLVANRSNVDWALMNFMQDWFPEEAKEKLKSNEKEASDEQMQELGIDPDQPCLVM